MNQGESIDAALLDRYLAGESTAAEADIVNRWASERPERQQFLAALAHPSGAFHDGQTLATWDAEAARRRWQVQARLETHSPTHSPRLPRAWPRGLTWPYLGLLVAASAVVVVSGAVVWDAIRVSGRTGAGTGPLRTYTTRPGERAEIRLADRSRVMLGVASSLRVPVWLDAGPREVRLDGEAYFIVRHDSSHPFVVHTRTATAEDLGTEFDVRSYVGDGGVRVVVASGSVALRPAVRVSVHASAPPEALVLTSGQLGRVDASGTREERERVDPAAYTAWTAGRLTFKDTPMREAARDLSRWYNLDIVVADSLAERQLTTSFTTESAAEALAFVAPAIDARVEQHGRSITLIPLRRRASAERDAAGTSYSR